MGEHLLHSLIPAAASAVGNVASISARESHSAVPATHLGSIHFANSDFGRIPITNAAHHHNSAGETLESAADFESTIISGAEGGAATFADERLS